MIGIGVGVAVSTIFIKRRKDVRTLSTTCQIILIQITILALSAHHFRHCNHNYCPRTFILSSER